jgi:hypothetical protein
MSGSINKIALQENLDALKELGTETAQTFDIIATVL